MSAAPSNPLIDDRDVEFILDELIDLGRLLGLPYFAEHDRELLTVHSLWRAIRESAKPENRPAIDRVFTDHGYRDPPC